MEFRQHDQEDYINTLKFLELEMKMDEENCREMLNIEPSHLTKGKITEMAKLAGRYKKESNRLIKGIKELRKTTTEPHKENPLERKKTWFII